MLRWLTSWRFARLLLCGVTVLLLIGAVLAWRAADALTASRPSEVQGPPADFPADEVEFVNGSGDKLHGWYQRGEPGQGVVVVAHGIRGNRLASLPRARLIAEAGFSTLVFDLRCHGESTGDRITLGKLESLDIAAAVAFAKAQNPGEPVAVVGFSLGGAAAALAAPLDVDAVVLEAVFPSIEKAVRNRTRRKLGVFGPIGAWALLVQLKPRLGLAPNELRPQQAVARFDCPVMIVGGMKDHQTTPSDTRLLYASANEPKELVWFKEWGHNNYARWAPEKYRSTVVDFLSRKMSQREG